MLILYRHLSVIRATTIDAYHRPDGDHRRRDVATTASDAIPITQTGHLAPGHHNSEALPRPGEPTAS